MKTFAFFVDARVTKSSKHSPNGSCRRGCVKTAVNRVLPYSNHAAMHAKSSTMTDSERIKYNEHKRKHREAFPHDEWRRKKNNKYYRRLSNSFKSHTLDSYIKPPPAAEEATVKP